MQGLVFGGVLFTAAWLLSPFADKTTLLTASTGMFSIVATVPVLKAPLEFLMKFHLDAGSWYDVEWKEGAVLLALTTACLISMY